MSNDQVARDAAQHGYIAVTFEYDISAPGRWPREVDDVRAVIAWARSQASQWGGDPGKIATWGTSAGANLAVEVAAAGDHSGLSADVGWSGPYLLQALPQQATTGEQQVAATADPFIYLNCFIQLCLRSMWRPRRRCRRLRECPRPIWRTRRTSWCRWGSRTQWSTPCSA